MGWEQSDFSDRSELAYRHLHLHCGFAPACLALLLLLALAAISLLALVRARDRTLGLRARQSIYGDIRKALDEALQAATDDELVTRTRRLLRVYDHRLGALVRLTAGVGAPLETLRKAAETLKVKAKPKERTADEPACERGVELLKTPLGRIEFLPPQSPSPATAAKTPELAEDDITVVDRAAAVRKALEAFARAWRESDVDRLLADAQMALFCDRGASGSQAFSRES
jgi:hypothetical protein